MVVARNSDWDADHFLKDFNTGCYFSPLKLSEATNNTFLETTFKTTRKNSIRYWLKNENKPTEAARVWRYAHFHCYSNFEQKRTTLESCLKKVARNASDSRALIESGKRKILEFRQLQYPRKMLWRACTTMGVSTRDPEWFRIRESLGDHTNPSHTEPPAH